MLCFFISFYRVLSLTVFSVILIFRQLFASVTITRALFSFFFLFNDLFFPQLKIYKEILLKYIKCDYQITKVTLCPRKEESIRKIKNRIQASMSSSPVVANLILLEFFLCHLFFPFVLSIMLHPSWLAGFFLAFFLVIHLI